jgi:cell division inhibitor SepF
MGFLDTIRERFAGGGDDYYDDDYYDDGGDEGGYYEERPREQQGRGLLGNTPRPEAESVSVYTRSGRQISGNGVTTPAPNPTYAPSTTYASSYTGSQAGLRMNSGNLPPYVLRPASYEDVTTVVRRVRTSQPVVLNFRHTNIDIAKRVLDFCYGLSFGIDGEITELGDRVFAVLPHGITLSQTDIDKLVADGEITR